ncbi:FAD-dependent oxidoreductase [Desmospora activa]|uniref:Glucose inhibited division protein A n=1 Tax=Desmospora activa DSM 45169 TaxID=1121389 RepID=A0A2T4Z4T9_9BACL|nr:FAD-dependent oxidoreductase [Desmospora activa]PTM56900.1 glucose inhibited division protein A [Desmospora activa DSM 45169]
MANTGGDYDLIVITKGQAGLEAAKEAARLGKTALILKLNPGSIASVMCSTSMNGSPGVSAQEGVETERLFLIEDQDRGIRSFHSERLEADARHSVYILQGEQEDTSAVEQTSHDPIDTPSTSYSVEESTFPEEEIEAEATYEAYDNKPDHDQYDERDQFKETLRERDIQTRRKLLQRPSLSNRKPKPASADSEKKSFQKREPELRKRMSRKYPQPGIKKKEDRWEQKSSTQALEKSQLQPFTTSAREKPFNRKSETTEPPEQKTNQRPSIIPLNHKNKKSFRQEDSVRPTNPPQTSPMVWEANESDSIKKKQAQTEEHKVERGESRKKRQSSSSPLNSYQPFQQPKGTLNKKAEPPRASKEAPFSRKERTSPPNSKDSLSSSYGQDWSDRKMTRGPLSDKKQEKEKQQQEPLSSAPFATKRNSGQQPFMNQEMARHVLRNSSQESGLKQDHIDIEDPYGQSYEDFMEPFHSSEQEQQLEKRKLALRGLHNLINNLG